MSPASSPVSACAVKRVCTPIRTSRRRSRPSSRTRTEKRSESPPLPASCLRLQGRHRYDQRIARRSGDEEHLRAHLRSQLPLGVGDIEERRVEHYAARAIRADRSRGIAVGIRGRCSAQWADRGRQDLAQCAVPAPCAVAKRREVKRHAHVQRRDIRLGDLGADIHILPRLDLAERSDRLLERATPHGHGFEAARRAVTARHAGDHRRRDNPHTADDRPPGNRLLAPFKP